MRITLVVAVCVAVVLLGQARTSSSQVPETSFCTIHMYVFTALLKDMLLWDYSGCFIQFDIH